MKLRLTNDKGFDLIVDCKPDSWIAEAFASRPTNGTEQGNIKRIVVWFDEGPIWTYTLPPIDTTTE